MKTWILFIFFSYSLAAILPNISEYFESQAHVHVIVNNQSNMEGEVFWAADQPKGMEVEIVKFRSNPYLDTYFLIRYDIGSAYEVNGNNNEDCLRHPLSGNMSKIWDWVAQATYGGRINMNGNVLDIWEFTKGYAQLTLGVSPQDPNIPVFLRRISPQLDFFVFFHHWDPSEPDSSLFSIPHSCTNNTLNVEKRCVTRGNVISRAAVWVANKVPYNQDGTYQGYREDCSGYVSMAWELSKPGLTTRTLGTVSHSISKGDLQSGDILLNAAEHVVIFGGWADSSHSQYVAYEETRPGEGTVKRVTPYPYWYNKSKFLPYRYNNIC